MTYTPLFDNLVVSINPQPKEIIELPEEMDTPVTGTVVEIGPGLLQNGVRTPMEVRPQSQILFYKRYATKISDDPELYVLNQDEILVVLED